MQRIQIGRGFEFAGFKRAGWRLRVCEGEGAENYRDDCESGLNARDRCLVHLRLLAHH